MSTSNPPCEGRAHGAHTWLNDGSCLNCGQRKDVTPNGVVVERAVDAMIADANAPTDRPQDRGMLRFIARTVLDAIGYDALVAERDRLREALHEIRWCAEHRPREIRDRCDVALTGGIYPQKEP